MKCNKCGSDNTEVVKNTPQGNMYFVIRCKDCGTERLPTQQERSVFNE